MGKSLIDFLLFTTIFVNAIVLFKFPFEGYLYYIVSLIFIPFFSFRFGVPKLPLLILLFPICIGMINVILGNNSMFNLVKISGGLLFLLTFYYGMISYYDFDIEKMFKMYLKWCLIIAYIGIFQIISFVIGFKLGYDFSWILNKWTITEGSFGLVRLNSIFSEPSQYGITMAPAAFLAVRSFVGQQTKDFGLSKLSAAAILSTYILTTSSLAFIGLLIVFVMYFIEKRKFLYIVLLFIVLPVVIYYSYGNILEIQVRADSFYNLFVLEDFSVENVNNSSFVLLNNFVVSWNNFLDHPFGTGLGSHEFAYEKYSLTRTMDILQLDFNKNDANSTFFRLLSETGFVGVFFIIYVLAKFYVPLDSNSKFAVLSNSILVLILLHLFRQGNYFLNGFPFFMLLYYFNGKAYIDNLNKDVTVSLDEKISNE